MTVRDGVRLALGMVLLFGSLGLVIHFGPRAFDNWNLTRTQQDQANAILMPSAAVFVALVWWALTPAKKP